MHQCVSSALLLWLLQMELHLTILYTVREFGSVVLIQGVRPPPNDDKINLVGHEMINGIRRSNINEVLLHVLQIGYKFVFIFLESIVLFVKYWTLFGR